MCQFWAMIGVAGTSYYWQLMCGSKEYRDYLLHYPFHGSLILSRRCFDDPGDSITLANFSDVSMASFDFSDPPESLCGLCLCRVVAA